MTRINVDVKAKILSDEHLRAEHRDIKRICIRFMHRLFRNKFDGIPQTFRLGAVHELFFVDKGIYTLMRYKSLYDECVNRGVQCNTFP